ncbi:MAG: NnrS family protein [Gammaproteobacteria bacterium]|nr:NnrS family protein [Gammaproteobacteria bacterium]MCP5135370.1 NnrS family protein [Gammaproteobacteria bacterium]
MATIPVFPRRPNGTPARGLVPFAMGFRPYFLLALAFAVAGMAFWVIALIFGRGLPAHYGGYWHAHEMLFGYAGAVVIGFLLTAIRNWTGRSTLARAPLAATAALWLAGRVEPWLPVPGWKVAIIDALWLPLMALALAVPLIRAGHHKSLIFPLMVLLMGAANMLMHAEFLGWGLGWARPAGFAGLYLVLLMLTILGGRVVPFFTERGAPGSIPVSWSWLESWVVPLTLLHGIAAVHAAASGAGSGLVALTGVPAGVVHAARLYGWTGRAAWRVPMVWVLHAGYGAMALGFMLTGLVGLGVLDGMDATHALTAGAIGLMTAGMVTRVTLGHTGRNVFEPPAGTTVAFVAIALAGVFRVLAGWMGSAIWMDGWRFAMALSGSLWVLGFLVLLWGLAPMLLRSRVDGGMG